MAVNIKVGDFIDPYKPLTFIEEKKKLKTENTLNLFQIASRVTHCAKILFSAVMYFYFNLKH